MYVLYSITASIRMIDWIWQIPVTANEQQSHRTPPDEGPAKPTWQLRKTERQISCQRPAWRSLGLLFPPLYMGLFLASGLTISLFPFRGKKAAINNLHQKCLGWALPAICCFQCNTDSVLNATGRRSTPSWYWWWNTYLWVCFPHDTPAVKLVILADVFGWSRQ